jgi:uncharacterized protein involved in exopolysaccharide biosynthesis
MRPPGLTAPPPTERFGPPPIQHHGSPSGLDGPDAFPPYASALNKHRRLIIALPLTLAVVAMGLSLLRPRVYRARAAFIASEPSSMSSSLGALSSVASQLGIPALSAVAASTATSSAQFYGELLTSSALLQAVVATRYDAGARNENGGRPFVGTLVEYIDPSGPTATDRELSAMEHLAKNLLDVAVDRPTGIVRFEVRTKNRLLSALVARRMLDLVNDFNVRRRQTQAGAERDFDARRTRAALDSLHAAEAALADFRAANIDFSKSPRLAARDAQLQRAVTMGQQVYTTITQRYELANIEAVRNTPVVTVLDGPEGLVEARPRYTVAIAFGAFVAGLVIACVFVLSRERVAAQRVAARP